MNYLTMILAETGGDMGWVITLVTGVIAAVFAGVSGLIYGNRTGKKEAEGRDVTLKKPVPTFQVREEQPFATRPELVAYIERTDDEVKSIWEAIQAERGVARTALARIHERIDNQSQVTAKLQGSVDEVGKNVRLLLDRAVNPKPNGRS